MKITILDERRLSLGEGINKDPIHGNIAWVDINKKKIYHKLYNENVIDAFDVKFTPSSILKVGQNYLLVLDDVGIGKLELSSGNYKRLKTFEPLANDEHLRANDGLLVENELFFGVMGFNPIQKQGAVYKYVKEELTKIFDCCIPNTFIKDGHHIFISDSMKQVIYKYDVSTGINSVWKDFSESNLVPDGACLDNSKGFYICMWGAGEIHNYSFSGELLDVIKVPVKNPTKCVLIDNKLIVTSAFENVSAEELNLWPKSGQTFCIKLR